VNWCWLAWLSSSATLAPWARADARDLDGTAAGTLAAWPAGRKPVAGAVRMAARLVDPAGAAAEVSLLLLPRDRSPLFDDPAVSCALRAVLTGPPADGVSTLVRDSSHFAGAVTVRREPAGCCDPFARLGPARALQVGAGLFGRVAPPPGPVIQRYAGKPWPAAGF
jgi:hypothetical protein